LESGSQPSKGGEKGWQRRKKSYEIVFLRKSKERLRLMDNGEGGRGGQKAKSMINV